MGALDENIFGKMKFSSLLEEIYNNQKKKQKQIDTLINELKPLVNDMGDATLLVPLIAGYLDSGIKNDEQLIKVATIIQRIFNNSQGGNGDGGFEMSPEEREQLLSEVDKLHKKDE